MNEQGKLEYIIIYQVALFALAMLAIGTLCGSFALAYNRIMIPDSIVAMGSAAVGAIAGLLSPSPLRAR